VIAFGWSQTLRDPESHQGEGRNMKGKELRFNVLIKKEEELFIAHCLELDIVATALSAEEAGNDLCDLIKAQVAYAFSNDNLANLYHPAPRKVWEEFYACDKKSEEKALKIPLSSEKTSTFVPPEVIASTCLSLGG
jgi:hypothetical protein